MFWYEQRTAILIRLDGNVVRADFSGDLHDFELVIPDERTKNRRRYRPGNHINIFDRLRSNLSDTVACNEYPSSLPLGDLLCKPEHVATIENHARIEWSIDHDVPLNFGKWHEVQLRPKPVFR